VEIVRQCERAGLIVGQRLYLDGPLVAADASRDSMRSRALLAQVGDVDAHIAAMWRDNPPADADEPPGEPATPLTPISDLPSPLAEPPGRTNDLARSRTDPDAALLSRERVPLDHYH
jgi:hypothetical protein